MIQGLFIFWILIFPGVFPFSGINTGFVEESVVAHESFDYFMNSESFKELDPASQRSLRYFGQPLFKYSGKYRLDWRLSLAIMKKESRFNPHAESHKGAYGLMQIIPTTQEELTQKLGIENATDPYNNIKAGVFYFSTLMHRYGSLPKDDQIRFSLAAYNAGSGRVSDAQKVAEYLGLDKNNWEDVRHSMELLRKRYDPLHIRVWDEGKPGSGYFREWPQTVKYVDDVMMYYSEYQEATR